MKLAAIDIGSNAARLLIEEVTEDDKGIAQFNKLNLFRVPLRLGFDVFSKGEISTEKKKMFYDTMNAYAYLLDAYNVSYVKACATSAMRDAANSQEIINKIKEDTGITISVITGDEEAAYIYENHIAENMDKEHAYLYIDVGGGSTELSFFNDGKLTYKQSFNIGTIRLLKSMVTNAEWDEMKAAIKTHIKSKLLLTAIGSGGNINKVHSLSKRKDGQPLRLDLLKDYYKEFSAVDIEERIRLYNFREDRADVIVPALQIYINVMRWADIEEIHVPKIGLADGLIHSLYEELNTATTK